MPRNILQQIREDNRKKPFRRFLLEQKEKAPRRKPARTKDTKPERMTGTLFAKRNKTTSIREAALRRVSIIIKYTKITTRQTKHYEINVLSYRMRKLKKGRRKVLFGLDKNDDKQLKNFVVSNIRNVILTDRHYKPNPAYPVEIR